MITEAVVLAGGLGTRLREAVPDVPKVMAPVNGRPFLGHVIDYLRMQGVQHFVFSLGYRGEVVEEYLSSHFPTLDYSITKEEEPLGTGGAIQLGIQKTRTADVLAVNGDSLFKIDLGKLDSFHFQKGAECTLVLKPLQNFERYGVVTTDPSGRILSFKEKQFYKEGTINGGVYIINKDKFLQHPFTKKFSFESDYLERYYGDAPIYGLVQDGYFIDIGIPSDYQQAQIDFKRPPLDLGRIDTSWTLFLDRDGVINEEKLGEYVLHWEEFIFSKGVLETFRKLTERFGKVIVVSNQRGVGKQLMTEADLQTIHLEMQREVGIVGGKIDKIYYCTEKADTCFNRKPNPGMALQAKKDFPDIDFSKSIMVGNKPSDMRFGRAAGMFTVFVATTNPDQPYPHPDIDLRFDSLSDFAETI
jgi:D-glycero-alpha-D-manno-heptose 1-phosphate guanylyltransferase